MYYLNKKNMEKTLVYHVYLSDDIETNLAYKINAECLKYYITNFDNVKYVIVMDNLDDLELRLKGINYVSNIKFNGNVDIVFRKNTELGEAATVRDYVVNTNDNNEMIFFCHTKGISAFKTTDGKANLNSISMFDAIEDGGIDLAFLDICVASDVLPVATSPTINIF